MVSQRNRIVAITDFLTSLGINVSLCNNKARGNKGYFKVNSNQYVIQIAKNQTDSDILNVLVHEFAHFLHYCNDKTLKTLDFAFGKLDDGKLNELMEITIKKVPKEYATKLISEKNFITKEIRHLTEAIQTEYPDFKQSKQLKEIEKQIKKTDAKYLLRYDKVKVLSGFYFKVYSVDNIESDFVLLDEICKLYIKLKSYQRQQKRISSKISRLNRYYNSPTEMFARFLEFYVCENNVIKNTAPNLYEVFNKNVNENKYPILSEFISVYNT